MKKEESIKRRVDELLPIWLCKTNSELVVKTTLEHSLGMIYDDGFIAGQNDVLESGYENGKAEEQKRVLEFLFDARLKRHFCAACDGAECAHTLACQLIENLIKDIKK